MGVGYARVNSIMLDITGNIEAILQEKIFITNISSSDEFNTIVYSYDGTLLNSKVILSDNDINSTKSFEITMYNNTSSTQHFEDIIYELGELTYDNEFIDFVLDDRLKSGDTIPSKSSVTFTITFKYSDSYKEYISLNSEESLQNELISILNFNFGHLIKFNKGYGDIKPDNYYLTSNNNLHEIDTDIPKRTGYIFMGWYDNIDYQEGQMFYNSNQDKVDINDLVINDYEINLYPGWDPIKYTITYHYSTLPSDYQAVEYIETTGSNYIMTDIIPNDDMNKLYELIDKCNKIIIMSPIYMNFITGILKNVGLEYLTLARSAGTLSGGEAQRIRLATQIGSKLSGILYVLDEPSIGLHQRDNQRLIDSLKEMRDLGNTLIVVEHDTDTMLQSDYLVDIGPGAGDNGGYIVAEGTPEEVMKNENSITGKYLSGKLSIEVPKTRRKGSKEKLRIIGACENNLKKLYYNYIQITITITLVLFIFFKKYAII